MSDIDELVEHFQTASGFEIDHAVDIYIEPERTLSWRDVEKVRECGYRIQDIFNGEHQTCVTCVRERNIPPATLRINGPEIDQETIQKIKERIQQ